VSALMFCSPTTLAYSSCGAIRVKARCPSSPESRLKVAGLPSSKPVASCASGVALPSWQSRLYLADCSRVIRVFPVADWTPVPLSSPVVSPCTPDRGNFLWSLESHTASSLEAGRLAHAGSLIPPSDPLNFLLGRMSDDELFEGRFAQKSDYPIFDWHGILWPSVVITPLLFPQ